MSICEHKCISRFVATSQITTVPQNTSQIVGLISQRQVTIIVTSQVVRLVSQHQVTAEEVVTT
jgi:hypothetical protein